jgi:hypothetical protein
MPARVKRRLLKLATALSLLLCVTTAVLWARSYFWSHGASFGWRTRPGEAPFVMIYTGRGGIQLALGREVIDGDVPSMLQGRRYSFFHSSEDDPDRAGSPLTTRPVEYRHEAWGFGADRFTIVDRLFQAGNNRYYRVDDSPQRFAREATTAPTSVRTLHLRRVWFPFWGPRPPPGAAPLRWLAAFARDRRSRGARGAGAVPALRV